MIRDERRFGRRCVLGAALLWSLAGVVTKSIELGPLTIAFYRSLFAGLALLPLIPRFRWAFRPTLIPLGMTFGVMIGLYLGSVKATTAANAIFLQYTANFWMVLFSALFLDERPDRRAVVGIGLATVGCLAIVLYGYDPTRPGEGLGVAMGLASGLAYAAVAISFRGLRELDPLWLSAMGNLGGSLTLAGWLLATSGSIPAPTATQAAVLLGFGVIQMAIPYALFARGLRAIGAPEAGLIALVEPILAPVWVLLAQGEWPAPATLAGGLFLLAGLLCRYWPARRADPVQ